MSEHPGTLWHDEPPIEPERYELFEGPRYHFELDRRDFVKIFGGGLLIALSVDGSAWAFQQRGGRGGGGTAATDVSAFLHIAEDGKVTAYSGKAEVGQNARTSLAQGVAEELRCPIELVDVITGDTELCPYDAGTFGSRTTPDMLQRLRRAVATAREVLIDRAAQQWSVERATLAAAGGRVSHNGSDRSASYGQLAKGEKLVKQVAGDASLTPAKEWKVMGTAVPKLHASDIVTGRHKYTSDVARPGMVFGKVLRPEKIGSKLVSVDVSLARTLPGVTVVQDGDFVGVTAPSQKQAEEALAAIKAEWQAGPALSSAEFIEQMKKTHASGGSGARPSTNQGNFTSGLASADYQLQRTYTIAYIAHAPLEPRAAVAEWTGDKLTVWTGTQRPFGVQTDLATALRVNAQQVRVIVPDTGAGYGGKHRVETAIEAARLAKEAGKAVKLIWTREEEFTWAYFRPAGIIDVTAGVANDGKLVAWDFHNYNSGGSGIDTRYNVANRRITAHQARSPLAQGSYRGLAATANHFARECHMDDLAKLCGMEPLAFRLKNLTDQRMRGVLEAAAERIGWSKLKSSSDRGFGIAVGFEKGSYVATCAEVLIDRQQGKVQVERLVTAFECGAIVCPDHLANQVEGSCVMALGGALTEAIECIDSKIVNGRFSRYRVPHFRDIPKLETVLVDRKDLPSAGAGETPIVATAPAIGNAIFAATGVRLNSMPMDTASLKGA